MNAKTTKVSVRELARKAKALVKDVAKSSKKAVSNGHKAASVAPKAAEKAIRTRNGETREDAILALVRENPKGIDVHEIANELGIKDAPNSLPYKALRTLVASGLIFKGEDHKYVPVKNKHGK